MVEGGDEVWHFVQILLLVPFAVLPSSHLVSELQKNRDFFLTRDSESKVLGLDPLPAEVIFGYFSMSLALFEMQISLLLRPSTSPINLHCVRQPQYILTFINLTNKKNLVFH